MLALEAGAPEAARPHLMSRPGAIPAIAVLLAAALAISLVAGTALGGATIAPDDVLRFLGAALTGGDISRADVTGYQIVWQIRAPRVLLAALVGAALSACGAVLQAIVRNSLADPFILGVSAGASVGAVSVTIAVGGFTTLGLAALAATSNTVLVAAGAFLGAVASSALVWAAAHRGPAGVSPVRLVLTGVVIAAGLQALMAVLIYLVPDTESTATVLFWTMGSFGAAAWGLLPPVAAMTLLALFLFARDAVTLDVLAQGDDTAAGLGIDPARARRRLFAFASLATAAATAVSGAIGFVGLIIPHIVRMLVGASHRRVLLISPLVGAVFMVWADIAARTLVAPRELPLSAITALIGVPVFIALLRRRGQVLGA